MVKRGSCFAWLPWLRRDEGGGVEALARIRGVLRVGRRDGGKAFGSGAFRLSVFPASFGGARVDYAVRLRGAAVCEETHPIRSKWRR